MVVRVWEGFEVSVQVLYLWCLLWTVFHFVSVLAAAYKSRPQLKTTSDWNKTGPLRTVEDAHPPLETFFAPFLLTMHYLVTEASQTLLSLLWWMVLAAPQWPQWLARADKSLNGFSRNLIAPQSPKDTTRLQYPLQSPAVVKLKLDQPAFFLGTDLGPL